MIGTRTREATAAPRKPTVAMTPTSNMIDVVSTTGMHIPDVTHFERGGCRSSRENQGSHPTRASRVVLQINLVNAERVAGPVPTDVRDELYYESDCSALDGGRLARAPARSRPPEVGEFADRPHDPSVGRAARPGLPKRARSDDADYPAPNPPGAINL